MSTAVQEFSAKAKILDSKNLMQTQNSYFLSLKTRIANVIDSYHLKSPQP